MTFAQPTEFQRSDGDIPDALANVLEADMCSDAGG
jgi:hypothetical protein